MIEYCPTGKVRHDGRKEAEAAMVQVTSRQPKHVKKNGRRTKIAETYPCPQCGGWHWGHRPRAKVRPIWKAPL